MTSSIIGPHLLDTGPVLCLGGSSVIADLYDDHLRVDGMVVAVVADEVRGWAAARVAPGDPHRIGGVKRAGSGAVRRHGRTLLTSTIPVPAPEPTEIAVILQALQDYASRKRPACRTRSAEHSGETYSIYEANTRSLRFVSNDDGARHVVGTRSVPHESFVDVARRLTKCEKDVKPKQIVRELQRLVREGVDIGDVVNSVLDMR